MNLVQLLALGCVSALPLSFFEEMVSVFSGTNEYLEEIERPDLSVLQQPTTKLPKNQKHSVLGWGDVNIFQTTDTHGWFAGHLLEPDFGADYGDLVSFFQHVKTIATNTGTDVLFVDSGDRADGNGFSDASDPKNLYSKPVIKAVGYDLITPGATELYNNTLLQDEVDFAAAIGESYVSSNVALTSGATLGSQYRLWNTTNQQLRTLGLGFSSNTTQVLKNSKVHVKGLDAVVLEPWFQTLLSETVNTTKNALDQIVIAGHLPVRDPQFELLVETIRAANPSIPIFILGGASQVRDFKIFDAAAVGLQSGRFSETLGFTSLNLTTSKYERTYLDFNRPSFIAHSNVTEEEFDTLEGSTLSAEIAANRELLGLDTFIAEVPETYYTDRVPIGAPNNIFTLLQDKVLPLVQNILRPALPTYITLGTNSITYDAVKGNWTKDSEYIVAPISSVFLYIPDLPKTVADGLLTIINTAAPREFNTASRFTGEFTENSSNKTYTTPGYSTGDDLGKDGDDTAHKPWTFYPIPRAIQAQRDVTLGAVTVDFVFDTKLSPYVFTGLVQLGVPWLIKPSLYSAQHVKDLIPQYFNATAGLE